MTAPTDAAVDPPPGDVRSGLTDAEAAARLARDGRNDLRVAPSRSALAAVGRQLRDTVILVLLVAGVLTAAVGDAVDTAVILAVVVLDTALGAGQEIRSGRALDALARLTAPRATVTRGGRERTIPAVEVVRGDLVSLAAGDIVPADAEVVAAESLQCDEAMLTGESVPVSKSVGAPVYATAVVVRGRGAALVTRTGGATEAGGIAHALVGAAATTPLQRRLGRLGRRLALAVAVAAVVVAALNLAGGRGLETSVVLGISLAVAAIPESLPAVVSLALAAAAHRLSAMGVLTRRLSAVEALGSVTVLATDKTGTITEGRLALDRTWSPAGTPAATRELLEAGALCNDACSADGRTPAARDDPLEVALVRAALEAGIDVVALRRAWPRVAEQPFDAALARMTTTHRTDAGPVDVTKGAPERILPEDGDPAPGAVAADWARQGLRVLAVVSSGREGVRLLGLLGFRDPPRADASAVLGAFRTAGVRPLMVTGDHAATARAIARAVGIEDDAVHARVSPQDKQDLVVRLRHEHQVVAMTGDGVNDAPALHSADVGVAVGPGATEVARQAADLVLTREGLSVLVPAIAEGRRAYANVRRFLVYALSGGLAEVLIMLLGPAIGFAVPLQAGQILWVNLLTHGLPGVAMGNEPAPRDVLRRPPRDPREQLLDRLTATRVALLGSVITAVTLGAAAWSRHGGAPWQPTVLMALVFAQLAVALALRPVGTPPTANLSLPASVVGNVGLVLLAVAWAPLRELLRLPTLTAGELARAVAAGLVAAAAVAVPALVIARARRSVRRVAA